MKVMPKRMILFFFKIIVTCGVAWFAFRASKLNIARLMDLHISLLYVCVTIFILVLQILVSALRLRRITETEGDASLSTPFLAGTNAACLLLGQFLPSTIGGDIWRIAVISRTFGTTRAAACIAADRIAGFLGLLALALFSIPFALPDHDMRFRAIGISVLSLAALVAGLVISPRLAAILPGRFSFILPHIEHIRQVIRKPSLIILTLATHMLGALAAAAGAVAAGFPQAAIKAALIAPTALLASAVPVSVGGWGVREGVFAAAFTASGLDPAAGIAASVVLGLSQIAAALVVLPLALLPLHRKDASVI